MRVTPDQYIQLHAASRALTACALEDCPDRLADDPTIVTHELVVEALSLLCHTTMDDATDKEIDECLELACEFYGIVRDELMA